LIRSLGQLAGNVEREFLEIGAILGRSVETFERLTSDLLRLATDLSGPDADGAAAALEEAMQKLDRMAGGGNQTTALLSRLEQRAVEASARVSLLAQIVGEVGILAINGKIQAALVTRGDIDFSVFTSETGRLGQTAGLSTQQMAARLNGVRAGVASALKVAADFEHNEAKELNAVRTHIDAGLSLLAERRRKAAAAADSVAAKTQRIAQRIASTVTELQINDSVCQRTEHVRKTLEAMDTFVVGETAAESAADRLDNCPVDRGILLLGGVLHLQAAQLKSGGVDYCNEVDGLIRNLSALAGEAKDILAEAEAAFGGSGGGLFVAEISGDVQRATDLLGYYEKAREHTRSVVSSVSDGFQAMASDLATIQSIDADMRVMGLNATLKCGRLGTAGGALGVIAQELRACSKRMENCSRDIADVLTDALALSETLATASVKDGKAESDAPLRAMVESVSTLSSLGKAMVHSLEELRTDATDVSHALARTADGIDIHRRVEAIAESGGASLRDLALSFCTENDLDEETHQRIHRLTFPNYTMERERAIHRTFAGEEASPEIDQGESDTGSVDSLFL
jgi:hypothetical protein